ncbi:MAG: Protein of unknown function DUF4031, partial [uncultured Nocardioidaceae bacterium]
WRSSSTPLRCPLTDGSGPTSRATSPTTSCTPSPAGLAFRNEASTATTTTSPRRPTTAWSPPALSRCPPGSSSLACVRRDCGGAGRGGCAR